MFCRNCGKEIHDDAAFCGLCGATVIKAAPSSEKSPLRFFNFKQDGNNTVPVTGIVNIIGGIILTAFAEHTMDQEKHNWDYTYTAPFTGHELFIIGLKVAGICFLVLGIIRFVRFWIILNQKNK